MLTLMLAVLFACWMLFTVSMSLAEYGPASIAPFSRLMWNTRLTKMRTPPLSMMMKWYADKRLVPVFLFTLVMNGAMNILMFALGCTKVGMLIAPLQAFMIGNIIGQADAKTRLYGTITMLFELNAFAVSACLGYWGRFDLWWIPAILLFGNAVSESCGILADAEGVPGVTAIKEQRFK